MTSFDWRSELRRRPWWMNALFGFCLYMTFIYMPFDFFWKSVESDDEVWFGVRLHGWYAKLTEPLHWLIYARRRVRVLAHAPVDVAVGSGVCRADRGRNAGVESARSARRRMVGWQRCRRACS